MERTLKANKYAFNALRWEVGLFPLVEPVSYSENPACKHQRANHNGNGLLSFPPNRLNADLGRRRQKDADAESDADKGRWRRQRRSAKPGLC